MGNSGGPRRPLAWPAQAIPGVDADLQWPSMQQACDIPSLPRYSTWEPEEHILDPRLVLAYEEK